MSGVDFFGHIARFLQIKADNTHTMQLAPLAQFDARADGFFLVDPTDATKRVKFDVSGLTAATDRTITVLDGNGVLSAPAIARIDASRNLVDDGTDQAVFPTTNDAFALAAGGTYLFDGYYSITKGVNDVDTFMLFGGTATLTSIRYLAQGVTAATAGTAVAMLSQNVVVATEIEVAANGTGVHVRIIFQGMLECNAAGTFIPQINFSAATGSTPAVNVDTYFRIQHLGSNPLTSIGAWS